MKRATRYLLGLLGFGAMAASCIGRVEYGTPHCDYRVSGKVVNEDGEPVAGIEVSDPYEFNGVKDVTGADGKFSIESDGISYPDKLIVKDIDGEENGLYRDKEAPLGKFTQVKKGSGWYSGFYEAQDVVITVEKED